MCNLLVFMELFFESCTVEASQTGANTDFNAKELFKVTQSYAFSDQ